MAESASYQSIASFINHPFNPTGMGDAPDLIKRRQEFDRKYEKAKDGIFFISSTEFEGSYFLHLKIPSESRSGVQYDVVIQFFTPDDSVEKQETLNQYLLQFFSNSPSFVYQYAALYYQKGYLIDAFQKKLDSRITDPTYVPTGNSAKKELMYDKSLYFACKYILENSISLLQKERLKRLKTKSMTELLRSISGENPSSSGDVVRDLKVEMQKDKSKAKKFIKDVAKLSGGVVPGKGRNDGVRGKKTATSSTATNSRETIRGKKSSTHSTLSTPRKTVHAKKLRSTSTTKKK